LREKYLSVQSSVFVYLLAEVSGSGSKVAAAAATADDNRQPTYQRPIKSNSFQLDSFDGGDGGDDWRWLREAEDVRPIPGGIAADTAGFRRGVC